MSKGALLHVGCGGALLPDWAGDYDETRLDIDERHSPDIVASMIDMGEIGPFDAIFSSHCLEHLPPHEVRLALSEFKRVLKPGAFALIVVPDLEDVKATDEPLFTAPCGPICGLDLIYGLRSHLEANPYMAHRSGFVRETLQSAMDEAGFSKSQAIRMSEYNLMGVAIK